MKTRFLVEFVSGETKEVSTILADQIRFEDTARRHGWPTIQEAPIMACAFFAFAGLKRTNEYSGTWDEFLAEVVLVSSIEETVQGKATGMATLADSLPR